MKCFTENSATLITAAQQSNVILLFLMSNIPLTRENVIFDIKGVPLHLYH